MRSLQTSIFRAILALVLMISTQAAYAVIHFVSLSGNNANDGLTWATAKSTLQPAINDGLSGDEVWVAAGTYVVTGTGVTMKSGVSIYGGFIGSESLRSQRNPTANVTILDDVTASEAVIRLPTNAIMTIDGFTIKNGSFGIYLYYNNAPTISNNIIRNNQEGIYANGGGASTISNNTISNNTLGGGIIYSSGSPTINNNTISQNISLYGSGYAGGIYLNNTASAIVSNNMIFGNTNIGNGGGITFVGGSSNTVINNVIMNNSSSSAGGGVSVSGGSNSKFTNNLIQANSAAIGGGVYITSSTTLLLKDCLITANSSSGVGGLEIDYTTGTISNCTIASNIAGTNKGNCKFFNSNITFGNNIVTFNTSGLLAAGTSTLTLATNDVYGNTDFNYSGLGPGSGDINADPLFVDPIHNDYHLATISPAIESGTDSFVTFGDTDLDGNPRIYGTFVDIGAYEWSPTYPDINGLTVSVNTVPGGQSLTGTVTLTAPALSGGATIPLVYNAAIYGIVSGPASVTVPQGATSASFAISTIAVSHAIAASVSAHYRGITQTANFTVAPYLSSLTLAKSEIPGGGSTTGTITLTGPAPNGGVVVNLFSGNTNVATVPASVTVPAGASSATFTITGGSVTYGQSVVIMAVYGSQHLNATLLVDPAGVDVKKVTLNATSVVGSLNAYGVVTLTAKAPVGGVLVPLTSSNPAIASVPAYIMIAQGKSSGSFPITTTAVLATTSITISASLTTTKTVTLSVKTDAIGSVVLQPSPAQVGDTIIGFVTLLVPAPAGGINVTFTTTTPSLISPDASVFIPAGQTVGFFFAEALAAGAAKVTAHLGAAATLVSITISP